MAQRADKRRCSASVLAPKLVPGNPFLALFLHVDEVEVGVTGDAKSVTVEQLNGFCPPFWKSLKPTRVGNPSPPDCTGAGDDGRGSSIARWRSFGLVEKNLDVTKKSRYYKVT
jgi:hypothetical protein